MNNSDTTSTGYAGSTMYSSGLEKAKTIIATSFDESSILYKYVLLTTAATDGVPSKTGWYRSTVEIMTEQMVYGCPIRQQMSATGTSILNRYIEKTQLPLFALRPDMITNRSDWWLRDIASDTDYCAVSELGFSDTCAAGDSYGVRPAFCIF